MIIARTRRRMLLIVALSTASTSLAQSPTPLLPPEPAPVVLQSRSAAASDSGVSAGARRVDQQSAAPRSAPATESRPLGMPQSVARRGESQGQADGVRQSSSTGSLMRSVASLAGVVVLAVALMAGYKRLVRRQGGIAASLGPAGRAPSGLLEVLGRYPIASGLTLVVLKMDRRILLLSQSSRGFGRGGSAAGFTTLTEITDPEEVASILVKARDDQGESIAQRFNGLLRRADAAYDTPSEPAPPPPMPEPVTAPVPEPKPPRRAETPAERAAALVESLRGQIPFVDLTQRAAARERAELNSQLAGMRARVEGAQRPAARRPATAPERPSRVIPSNKNPGARP